MSPQQKKAVSLLEQLILADTGHQQRSPNLLACPDDHPPHDRRPEAWEEGWCVGWAFAVQPTLADALDIKLTPRVKEGHRTLVWTQGSAFAFRAGYTIHDAPEAWTMPWGNALRFLTLTLQIVSASPAVPMSSNQQRDAGKVSFRIYSPSGEKNKAELVGERTVTQDDFVRILIGGLDALSSV